MATQKALNLPPMQKEPDLARARSGRTLHAIKEGWMHKKGGKSFSAFRRRYMILWTNKRIEYYTSDTLSTMKGCVNLLGLHRRFIQRSDKIPKKGHMYGFQIATDKRVWYFAVKNEKDREEWIATIRAAVDAHDGGHATIPQQQKWFDLRINICIQYDMIQFISI